MTNAEKFKTADERLKAFGKWHEEYCGMRGVCAKDDVCAHTVFAWLDMEAEEEKPLPCPFCGGEVETAETLIGKKGFSCSCGYTSKAEFGWDAAIAAHNRVARSVVEAGKKEETP